MKDRSADKPVPARRQQPPARKKRAGRSPNASGTRQTVARYRRLLDATSDAVYVLDRRLRFSLANRAGLRFLGLTGQNIEGKRITDLFPRAPEAAAFTEIMAALEKRASTTISAPFAFGDRKGWFEANLDPVPSGWVCILRDISETKRDAQALVESESRFRSLFETIQDSIFIIDRETLDILSVNPAACRLYGYTAEEFRKMKNVDVSAEPGKTETAVRTGATAVPVRYHRKKDGTVFPVEITGGYFEQAGRRFHTAFIRDCSERLRLEEALEKDRRELQLMIDASPIIIFYKDRDGRFVRVNKAFTEALNRKENDLIGRTVFELYSPDIARGMAADDREVLDSGKPKLNIVEQYEATDGLRWVRTDKTPIYDADGSVSGLIGFAQDITERKTAEEALLASEKRFRALIENSSDAISLVGPDGTVMYNSPSYTRLMGYRVEDRVGRNTMELIHPGDVPVIARLFREIVETPGRIDLPPLRVRHVDGSWRWIEGVAQNFLADPDVKAIVVNFRDITARRAAKEALEQSEARFRDLAELLPQTIYEMDREGTLTYVNRSGFEATGYGEDDLRRGFNITSAVIPEDRDRLRDVIRRILGGEKIAGTAYTVLRKDGSTFPVLAYSVPIVVDGRLRGLRGLVVDVSDLKELEKELKKRLQVEQLATEISADFVNVAYDQIDAAIRRALKKTTLYAGARLGSLFMVTPDGSTVTNTHEWCAAPEDSPVGRGPRLPFGIREFHLTALSRNRAVSVGRPADYPADEEGERELAAKYGFRPFVLAPLFRGGELIGVVGVYGETGREIEWPAQFVTLLGLIGDGIVNLLDRKQAEAELHLYREHLEELVAQRTEELERSRAAAIKLMETATAQRQRAEEALAASNRMAEALSESQTMLRLATRSAKIGIVETDLASGELIWDATCADIHGLPADAAVTLDRYFDEIVAPKDRAAVRVSLEKALAATGGHWGREYRIVRPGGEERWITEDYVIIRGHDGAAVRLIGATQDVTVRKQAEAELRRTLGEKETLLREIHHRVKNNLNTISNLIYFQAKLLKDKQAVAAFRDSQNRIQSMARIHEHLYRSWDLARVDMTAYLSDLVVDLSQTYGVQTTKLELTVAALALDIDQAVPCGLIMNELVSNAMKYAFDKNRKNNKITISLAPEGDRIVLGVADNGLGLPSNWDVYSADSLGIRLVNMFCKQLAGELGVKSAPGAGTSFRISFGRAREGAVQ